MGGEGESMQPFYPKVAFSWDHTKNSSRRLDGDVKQSLPAVLNVIHACSPFCTLTDQPAVEKRFAFVVENADQRNFIPYRGRR